MTAITRSSMVAAMCVAAAVALGAAVTRANPQKFAVGGGPEAVAFDGSYLWVTNQFTDTVTKMMTDGSIVGTYGVGERPLGAPPNRLHVDRSGRGRPRLARPRVRVQPRRTPADGVRA